MLGSLFLDVIWNCSLALTNTEKHKNNVAQKFRIDKYANPKKGILSSSHRRRRRIKYYSSGSMQFQWARILLLFFSLIFHFLSLKHLFRWKNFLGLVFDCKYTVKSLRVKIGSRPLSTLITIKYSDVYFKRVKSVTESHGIAFILATSNLIPKSRKALDHWE